MSPRTSHTTQIFCASTLYGAVTLAAAIDSDLFEEAERRVLLVFNNTATPETSLPLDAMPGFAPLRDHFDEVLSWNEAIRPFHPGSWAPRPDDIPSSSAICGCCGASARTVSNWSWSPSRSPPPSPSPRSSPAPRSTSTPTA